MTVKSKKTILLVDSHKPTLEAYKGVLEDQGYSVLAAESTAMAFDMFKAGSKIDMIISDVHRSAKTNTAPEIDFGIELCRNVRAHERKTTHVRENQLVPFIIQTHWLVNKQDKALLEGRLRQADGMAGKALLVSKGRIESIVEAIAHFEGRKRD